MLIYITVKEQNIYAYSLEEEIFKKEITISLFKKSSISMNYY